MSLRHISGKRIAGAGLLLVLAGLSLWRSFAILSAPSLDLTCAPGRRRGMCEIGVWLLRLFDSDLHRPLLSASYVGFACLFIFFATRALRARS